MNSINSPEEPREEFVYAPALLILSEDLYPRKLEVIREYIQNASDAIDSFSPIAEEIEDEAEPQIKVSIQGRSLLIFDNGIGMDGQEVAKLRRIAYSEKKVGEEAGYKGIGRLAGIAVAEKLKISSTSYGDPELHHFEFRAQDMRDDVSENKKKGVQETASVVIERHTRLWNDPVDPKEHYTLVEVRGISQKCEELLDVRALKEYIGEVAPVDFSPEFQWGAKISQKLKQNVPDYSPKKIYLSAGSGERVRVFKPFVDDMSVAEPDFIDVSDPANPNEPLAYCWYATKGQKILSKTRPAGRIFAVEGGDKADRQRFAGLVYKLFGFSIGDRTLPVRTLWPRSSPRALWFTGEIHIIDKGVLPTTDRSDFVETDARRRLYGTAGARIQIRLNRLAQGISDDRKAYDDSAQASAKFNELKDKLQGGRLQRAEIKTVEHELYQTVEKLKTRGDKCADQDIQDYNKEVIKFGRVLEKELDEAKKARGQNEVTDLAKVLDMTSKAKKVYEIIMEALSLHYERDPEEYYEVAGKIETALRKKYA